MIFLVLGAAYMLGSISFAVIGGFLFTGEDIRIKGSGNAGATNVFRVLGWKVAIPVFLADFLKGFLPVFFASSIISELSISQISLSLIQLAILLFLLLGHAFPLWFHFKGGKGVATAAGGVTALFPPAAPICLILFILIVVFSRYVSLASLITAWFLPLFYSSYMSITNGELSLIKLLFFIVIAFMISLLHRSNVLRLLKGEERKIHFRGRK